MDDGVRGDEAEIDTVEIDDVDCDDEGFDAGFDEVPIRCWDDLLRVTRSTSVEDVELATLGWADWFNNRRLHSTLGDVPPAESEAAHYAQLVSSN
jgi:transposase InsO family protein